MTKDLQNKASEPRPKVIPQFFKFGFAGGIAAIVNLVAVSILDGLHFSPWLSLLLGLFLSKNTGFIINRRYTFRETRHQNLWAQYFRFWSSTSIGSLINYSVALLLTRSFDLFYEYPQLAVCGGIACGMFFNFAASRHWVFNHREPKKPE